MNLPSDICNQALDAAGIDMVLGVIQDGTRPAQVLLRAYGQCLRQLLRTAKWDFARKQIDLVLLADASGNTQAVGTNVMGGGTGFIYEYEYPIDCLMARFIPWNYPPNGQVPAGNIVPANPSSPSTTGGGQQPIWGRQPPTARFLIANDPNYPPIAGINADDLPPGSAPDSRTVILTNVRNAQLVYTGLMIYPSVWDALFRAAFVAYLASEIAMPLHKDKKLAMQIRRDQIAITKSKIEQARMIDGNEGTYNSSIATNWMQGRISGGPGILASGYWGADGMGLGGWSWPGWAPAAFADGTAF